MKGIVVRACALAVVLAVAGAAPLGRADTVGQTDRDLQSIGPSLRILVNDTARGLHVAWKDGEGDIRYNFRPRRGDWRWPGGTVANTWPRNFGGMDVDLVGGRAIIGADYVTRGRVVGAYLQDSASAAGRFVEVALGYGYRHLAPATARYGWFRFAGVRNDTVSYLSLFGGLRLGPVGSPPTHSVAGARSSSRFCYTWSAGGDNPGALMLKETPNNGQNWYATVDLSDTSGIEDAFAPQGAHAVYDSIRLYIATVFTDGSIEGSARLWLYAKYDPVPWHPVHDYALPDSARPGAGALAAGRPTIGRNPRTGELFIAWEQFDPLNVEPRTGLCRADIWVARSQDNGRSWSVPVRLTGPDPASRRFPFIADVVEDTLRIACFEDLCAGAWEYGEGPRTTNPVLLLSVATSELPVALQSPPTPHRTAAPPAVFPTVSRRGFDIHSPGPVLVRAWDPAGRLARRARLSGPVLNWGADLPPGMWFLEFEALPPSRQGTSSRVRVIRLP